MSRAGVPAKALGALIGAAALLGLAAPAGALAAPALGLRSSHLPNDRPVPAGTYAHYTLTVTNPGTNPTAGEIRVDFSVPAGLRIIAAEGRVSGFELWECAIAPDGLSVACTGLDSAGALGGPFPIGAGREACTDLGIGPCRISITLRADEDATPATLHPTATACGGGVSACPTPAATAADDPAGVSGPPVFDVTGFDGEVLRGNGDPETQAGGHPHTASTEFFLATRMDQVGHTFATQNLKDALADIPPGLVGNPEVAESCIESQLLGGDGGCPIESQVGTITLWVNGTAAGIDRPALQATIGLFNMQPPFGTPGVFGFNYGGVPVYIFARVRTGEDYGITAGALNAAETLPLEGVGVSFWGVPADSSHDAQRGDCIMSPEADLCPSTADSRPFISLPTACVGPVETFLHATSWLGGEDSASFLSHDNTVPIPNPVGNEACASVPFDPSIEARPTTTAGDSPSGLDVELVVPQNNDDPDGIASAHLRDTTVTLPEGLVINPSGANGLDACSLAQFGYTSTDPDGTIHTTPDAATCPEASKVATVQVDSPLLDHPLRGAAYIATPHSNPFDSLLALYISLDDPQTGIVAKLAGEVSPDPATGQLTTSFTRAPQLPFESFRLNFFGGAGGPLRTPAICGTHTVDAELVPWSAPDAGSATWIDAWQIDQGCSGSAAQMPHAPSFDAGAVVPIAGAHSPFVVHLRREDGSQNFSAVTVRPPPGLVAKLAGTPICSDAALAAAAAKSGAGERASASCPAASEVGSVSAAAGAGPAPYNAPGKVYLSGPYKGAPLSLATVIPATAGPFDLGTVVTRIAAHIDSKTAEITAESDPLPTILQGIPLDVRTVSVSLDKPNFSLNPTNCSPLAVNGLLTSTLGQLAPLSRRFQLGECTGLGFKPRMTLRLRGGTKRGAHPALTIALMPRAGDANIASVSVALPRSEFLENAHIRTICTRPDFAADACPVGAIYGEATVDTPLLDYDLAGHVYLRSSDNLLPDVVPDLRGPAYQPIRLETAGRTDSIKGGIRTTIDFVPDAPFTKATVALQGGNKGLLVNSRNICARAYRAKVVFTAHNGAVRTIRPKLKAQCKKKGKKRKAKRGGHGRSKRLAQRSAVGG